MAADGVAAAVRPAAEWPAAEFAAKWPAAEFAATFAAKLAAPVDSHSMKSPTGGPRRR